MSDPVCTPASAPEPICCTPKSLPREEWLPAAATAIHISPANRPRLEKLTRVIPEFVPTPVHLAALTNKYWGPKGVKLSVSFLDNPPASLRSRILLHMNAWRTVAGANVTFSEARSGGDVRIIRTPGSGYASYLGTDILHIPAGQPTFWLDSFSDATPESEFIRVVRHEAGHTIGFPHEHLRDDIVEGIDGNRAISYFERTQRWTAAETRAQVLTPISAGSLLGASSVRSDTMSIMCYQLPAEIMRNGLPILGGLDIDDIDRDVASKVYPLPVAPPPPPPPDNTITLSRPLPAGSYRVTPI